MNDTDRELLDRVRALHGTLTQRTLLLSHVQSNVDIFAEGMRDLGEDLADIGGALLARVRELDELPSDPPPTALIARLAGRLADLGDGSVCPEGHPRGI
ncbi:hypothetical protein [Amycolatopsis sp. CA-230715]|uniref:hypothetical protein n=1 Tax=Amycolatopsis sp. CA-230715 TaxID=2745196 RepID=UPI001C02CC3D|nr:hypothetical protein [Amycolatopsis sp. CA-230715]QWF81302.1 hypothetical protein HUW46_04732 [Amycolatopsis sp. CA-230715]